MLISTQHEILTLLHTQNILDTVFILIEILHLSSVFLTSGASLDDNFNYHLTNMSRSVNFLLFSAKRRPQMFACFFGCLFVLPRASKVRHHSTMAGKNNPVYIHIETKTEAGTSNILTTVLKITSFIICPQLLFLINLIDSALHIKDKSYQQSI